MPNLSGYPVRSSVSTTDRLPICTAGSDELNGAAVAQILEAAGAAVVVPDSAPLLGSNAGGTLSSVQVGSGLSLVGGVLSASGASAASYLGPILGEGAALVRPTLASLTQVAQAGVAAGSITYTETTPGPITLVSQNSGYNVTALCLAPPTSGNWSYDMLIEALPFGSGPGLYLEDATGRGFVAYFYESAAWLGQYTTARNNYVSQYISYNPINTPQTLWYRIQWDATAQSTTILVSSNRLVWSLFGEALLVSAGNLGVPVLLGPGCINIGAFGAQMHLWHLAPSSTV